MAYVNYNQSILFGLQIQLRQMLLLCFFPIYSMMKKSEGSVFRLKDGLLIISGILGTVLLLQFIIGDKISIINYDQDNLRFGSIRITLGYMVVILGILISSNDILKHITFKNVCLLLLLFFDLVVVIQGRMAFFGVVIGLVVAFIITNKIYSKSTFKKIILILLVLVFCVIIFGSNVSKLFNLALSEVSNNSGNYVARINEIDFYTRQVDNPILGRGMISSKTKGTENIDSKYGLYSITDIGIFGLYTTNGIIGVIWYFLLCILIF